MTSETSENATERTTSPDRVLFQRLYTNYGILGFGLFIVLSLVFVLFIYIANNSTDPKFKTFVDIAAILYTAFISFVLARNVTTESYHREAARLGRIAARRIIELHKKMGTLASSIKGFDVSDQLTREHYSHIINNLTSFRGDVRLTLNDTKEMASLPMDEDDLSIEEDSVDISLVYQNKIRCPTCHTENTVDVPNHSGGTKTVTCTSCSTRFLCHRRYDGILFIGNQGQAIRPRPEVIPLPATPDAAVSRGPLVAGVTTQPLRTPWYRRSEQIQVPAQRFSSVTLDCPRCSHQSDFRYPSNFSYIKRGCVECFTTFTYHVDTQKFADISSEPPPLIHNPTRFIPCHGCGTSVRTDNPFTNSRGQKIVMCFKCGYLTIAGPGNEPEVAIAPAPTTGVGADVIPMNPRRQMRAVGVVCPNPSCAHPIKIIANEFFETCNRGCPECRTVFTYWNRDGRIEIKGKNLNKTISKEDFIYEAGERQIRCDCGAHVGAKYLKPNSKGERYLNCHHCGALLFDDDHILNEEP
jgi:hypothetical protein